MDIKTNGDIGFDEDQCMYLVALCDCWDGIALNGKHVQKILRAAAVRGFMTKEERAQLQESLETVQRDQHGFGIDKYFLPTATDYKATIEAYNDRLDRALGLPPVKEFG
jgi:hypothetical protein